MIVHSEDVIIERVIQGKCPICNVGIDPEKHRDLVKIIMYQGLPVYICNKHKGA